MFSGYVARFLDVRSPGGCFRGFPMRCCLWHHVEVVDLLSRVVFSQCMMSLFCRRECITVLAEWQPARSSILWYNITHEKYQEVLSWRCHGLGLLSS